MAVIATSKAQEDFIVQINGEYGIPFDEQTAAANLVSGQVIANGESFAIAAHDAKVGERVRVMVRGNPTSVNALGLTGYVAGTHKAALEAVGIIVVNE